MGHGDHLADHVAGGIGLEVDADRRIEAARRLQHPHPAGLLEISPRALLYKIKEYGI